MKRKILSIVFAFLFIMFFQQNTSVLSQIQTNSEVRPFTDLTLEISTTTQTLLPLQPIPITIRQSNQTNQPALGYKSIGFDFPIYFYVKKSGSNNRVQISKLSLIYGLTTFNNSEILPGVSYEGKEWIALNLSKYFPEPGNYELQAILANADRTQFIESKIINIDLQEPVGIDRNAYNLIKNSSYRDYIFSGAEFNKVKNTLETLITKYPNSAYAKSTYYVLGERHFIRKQYTRALIYLLRLENDDGFIFREKIKDYLTEIRQPTLNQQ